MTEIVIVEAVRSAVGRALKGSLALKRPDELAGDVIRGLLSRVPGVKPEQVDDVVLGCAMPEGEQGLNVARLAAILGGVPVETSAMTINRFCSSGLQAIALAAGSVALGHHEIVIAGGVESMSTVPMTGNKISASPELMDVMPGAYTPMGITAENVAKRVEISRAQQDEFAVKSHAKAAAARKAGKFEDEIVTVQGIEFSGGERKKRDFRTDELIREGTTLEGLGQLKPSFMLGGSVTPGNSSPLSDGAAAALVMSRAKASALGLRPKAVFRAFATAGVDPAIMGIGPVPAIRKLLQKTGLGLNDIDVIELNEAFAAQAVYVQRELGIADEKLNPNGGAIALGHPLGCTGAKLVATLIRELERGGKKRGIVSMCIGGGMGAAGLIELA
ncbi:MAG: thiolase family protein [Myxococcales bacterium]|nr:thiolase family protein [Myxococcales bacterium]